MKKYASIAIVFLMISLWAFAKFHAAKLEVEKQSQTGGARKVLHLFAMSDYFPEEIIKDFESKNNCQIRYDNFSSNEELLAKLQAGASGYDLIVPSDYMVRALIVGHLVRELDRKLLPNLINIANDFINVPYDPGSKFSAPYTWGTTGLIYNKKFVKDKIDSWNVLYEKQYAGHLSLLDDEREVMGAMLQRLGYSTNTSSNDELLAAQKELIKLKPSVRLFASDPKQHILSGDVWIAQIYSGDAHQIMRGNPDDYEYVTPKEGGTIWVDTMAIPTKASQPDLAHGFINYIMDPLIAKQITEKLLYSSPNLKLESMISEDFLKPSYLKKITVGRLEFLKDLGSQSQRWDQLWTEAKSH
jgi:spermidine/putrescine transport system substrate-binding protein